MPQEKNNNPDLNRRRLLKATGVGLAGAAFPTSTALAKSNGSFDATSFLEELATVDSESEYAKAWEALSDSERTAASEKLVATTNLKETTSREVLTTEDGVTPQAIPVSYSHTVQANNSVLGLLYELTHEIEWEIQIDTNVVNNPSASASGRAPALCWDWHGISDSNLDIATSSFDSLKEAHVTHPCGGTAYYPVIELRGHEDGSTTVLQADNGM